MGEVLVAEPRKYAGEADSRRQHIRRAMSAYREERKRDWQSPCHCISLELQELTNMLTMKHMHSLRLWQVVGEGSSVLPRQPREGRPSLPVVEAEPARKLMEVGLHMALSPSGPACVEWTTLRRYAATPL